MPDPLDGRGEVGPDVIGGRVRSRLTLLRRTVPGFHEDGATAGAVPAISSASAASISRSRSKVAMRAMSLRTWPRRA